MKGFLIATSMALIVVPTTSAAQTAFDVSGLFERIDADRDGRIQPAEIRLDSSADFDEYNLDGDGLLSREEVRKQQRLHGQKNSGGVAVTAALLERVTTTAFAYFDFDRDGRITREDYIQRGISQLMQADNDGDGALVVEELHRFHGQRPR